MIAAADVNDCLIVALRTFARLPGPPLVPWKRILRVHLRGRDYCHIVCVFQTCGRLYAHDSTGSQPLPARCRRDARSLARAIDPIGAVNGEFLAPEK
ncbi:MAG: hypothetical protein JO295_03690 [Verrucomicrobia bacterium]|nr:hypothetical protein [Verrucomicrobiota bacterium]